MSQPMPNDLSKDERARLHAGHSPIPKQTGSKPHVDCSEHVEVLYSHAYRCRHCGYTPEQFGCLVKMREHLREAHNLSEPPDAWWWMGGYSDSAIKELADERDRLAGEVERETNRANAAAWKVTEQAARIEELEAFARDMIGDLSAEIFCDAVYNFNDKQCGKCKGCLQRAKLKAELGIK